MYGFIPTRTITCGLHGLIIQALHDNTEVDLAAMVADSQWAVVQLKSDVASLAKKAAEAEEHYAVANKDNQRMQALINEKEECVLQGEKKLGKRVSLLL